MTQEERRLFLIGQLLSEQERYSDIKIPDGEEERKILLRSLMNVRPPKAVNEEFLRVQDEYLQEELKIRGITDIKDMSPVRDGIYIWQGDITTLKCGAVVNAANSGMTGCYVPCHKCIDNCIHTFAGVQLRLECSEMMKKQGHYEETGKAKITKAYNLPCEYVIHTVGPIISGSVTEKDKELLSSCYRSCLEIAQENNVSSTAFCCISTGEFHFPNEQAAEIAVKTVEKYKGETKVIFNVFKDVDRELYERLLR